MEKAVAYYIANRHQLGAQRAMQHTMQRFGVTAHEVRTALEARGLMLAQQAGEAQAALNALEAGTA